jgi:transposase-like protein
MSILFPFDDLLDAGRIHRWFEEILWPQGPVCPKCGGRDDLRVHSRRRAPILDWRCPKCGRIFNLFTGTIFQGTRHSLPRLFAIVRGIAQGVSTNQLHKELGCAYPRLLNLRHKIQDWVAQAVMKDRAIESQVTEADEMYQNAGEKRKKARRSGRSAAPARQQTAGPRHMGKRPRAGGGRGRT